MTLLKKIQIEKKRI